MQRASASRVAHHHRADRITHTSAGFIVLRTGCTIAQLDVQPNGVILISTSILISSEFREWKMKIERKAQLYLASNFITGVRLLSKETTGSQYIEPDKKSDCGISCKVSFYTARTLSAR